MDYHSAFGISVPEKGWVPSPSYAMRRQRILRLLQGMPPGRVLEIGCGAGALLHDLAVRGFTCEALETSSDAREVARYVNQGAGKVTIHGAVRKTWKGRFDYVLGFEVLEHIEDDLAALKQWGGWLKPGGWLVLSVPAHMRRWNASDELAGHIRRYEAEELKARLEQAGFKEPRVESWGFPLSNLLEFVRVRHHARRLAERKGTFGEEGLWAINNDQSGINRPLESRWFFLQRSLPGSLLVAFFMKLQGVFAHSDLGTGYLAAARRR